jgi:hypothetical protein
MKQDPKELSEELKRAAKEFAQETDTGKEAIAAKERPSYFEWLKKQGVEDIFPDIDGEFNLYLFASKEKANEFRNKLMPENTEEPFSHHSKNFALEIRPEALSLLRKKYLEDHPIEYTIEDYEKRLSAIKTAQEKMEHNKSVHYTRKLSKQHGKQDDRIGYLAQSLRNKVEVKKEGWIQSAATSTVDIANHVYRAINYDLLSKQEHKNFTQAQDLLLHTNKEGKFAGALKADANFTEYVLAEAKPVSLYNGKDWTKKDRVEMIEENVHALLDGGARIIIDNDTRNFEYTFDTDENAPNSYKQPRFFPDQNGKSETDTVVLQAGGMMGHASIRLMEKVANPAAVGKFDYFYTKIDAGAGTENYNVQHKVAEGIYTTKITPYYKTKMENGALVLDIDKNGNPQKMTEAEKVELDKNPEQYNAHMKATLFALIKAEREILVYKSTEEIDVHHGEAVAPVKPGEVDEWAIRDNIINELRGNKVATKETPVQLSGNCTMFSPILLTVHNVGNMIGYDMAEEFKTYDGPKVNKLLIEKEHALQQQMEELALSEVTKILKLDPKQISYPDKFGEKVFNTRQEAKEFKEFAITILGALNAELKVNDGEYVVKMLKANKAARIDFTNSADAQILQQSLKNNYNISAEIKHAEKDNNYYIELKHKDLIRITKPTVRESLKTMSKKYVYCE